MRRLSRATRLVRDAARDFTHAGRAQAAANWTRWRGRSSFPLGDSDCDSVPVVLLPGILERSTYLLPLGRFLCARGHPVHVVDALGWNISSLEESVERCLQTLEDEDVHGAVLVAHSKGGLIAKALLLDERLGDDAVGAVTVATPFAGSTLGGRLQRLVRRSPLGLFSPDNEDLERLAAERWVNSKIVSLAPVWDQMIPGGSHLEGAHNVTLADGGHFRPVNDPAVWEQIHTYLHELARRDGGESS